MPDTPDLLGHLLVVGWAEDRDFKRPGRGKQEVRVVNRRSHGPRIKSEATDALSDRPVDPSLAELRALGTVVTIEGAAGFDLKLESLEQHSRHRIDPRPKWLLLTVHAAREGRPEQAQVWVSDEYRRNFIQLFERYVDEENARTGKPKNEALVANIARIRSSVLRDLWQSSGEPPTEGRRWWEVWLRPESDAVPLARRYSETLGLRLAERSIHFDNRYVVWIEALWEDLRGLPFSAVPVTEIRRPALVDTVEDLDREEQYEYVDDLEGRIVHAGSDAPAACLLDTGVRRTHRLLKPALDTSSLLTVVGGSPGDHDGHGTLMAGLALFGPLDDLLTGSSPLNLLHRLESVKIIPESPANAPAPEAYGIVTAQAVAAPETVDAIRRRVFSMSISSEPDLPGEPSLWSAAVDALSAGTDIGRTADTIELLGPPSDAAKRLILVSAGNVDGAYMEDYQSKCDVSPIEDPAQSWNALTVGAHTELVDLPSDPSLANWKALAVAGDISPHSRTGVAAGGYQWPIKPDICMEGGNVLHNGSGDFHPDHPLMSLRTTDSRDDRALSSANATSAATSQAARLAARAMATYPDYWPETIRGLLTHTAEWTPPMKSAVNAETSKKRRRNLLRRFGWGVPDDIRVRSSEPNAVTMVVQDRFVPFVGRDHAVRHFRLHQLPWPTAELQALGEANVELRVTLSYFIEPSPSRRGWRRRYAYASHGLRFELQHPNEPLGAFLNRVNREAAREEGGALEASRTSDRWLLGPNQRNRGSLHQDIWRSDGAELATTGTIAVHAVGGWWKNNRRSDRADLPIRYALLVSLRTGGQDVDLYTPIAVSLQLPVQTAAASA